MFKENNFATEPTLFTSFDQTLSKKKLKRLEDKTSWDNLFRENVLATIDEKLFSSFYCDDNGRPNAPVRVLVGMNLLKDGFGWSDLELYEACRFNLLVMNALGLSNISDEVPVESTYYEFKKKLYEHQLQTGVSLIKVIHEQVTAVLSKIYEVNLRWIRMDSKLIGSNIATCTRLQLVIGCIQEFYKSLDEKLIKRIKKKDRIVLDELMKKKAYQIVYSLTDEQKSKDLYSLGLLLSRLVGLFRDMGEGNHKNKDKYLMISRLFFEQYRTSAVDGHMEVKPGSEVPSDGIQSPYDLDAAYSSKQDKKVKGYSLNIVESCNKEGLNLITGVEVYKANTPDSLMLQSGIEQTEKLSGQKVNKVSVDGAYNSQENQKYASDNNIDIYLSGITGKPGNYDIEEKDGNYIFRDKQTGEEQVGHKTKKGHYRITRGDSYRYFTKEQILSYFRRKEVDNLPKEIRDVRCNVEGTVFQMCYHLRKDKTSYRGLIKTKTWAVSRAILLNVIRVKNYVKKQLLTDSPALAWR